MDFDVCVSIVVHEEPDCVKDLVNNVLYFCRMKTKIVLHCNNFLFDICKKEFKDNVDVVVKDNHWNLPFPWEVEKRKKKLTGLITAHIENFDSMKKYKFKYFICLASNCLFVKPFTLDNIKNSEIKIVKLSASQTNYSEWAWPKFFNHDKNVADIFQSNQIELIGNQHEGALIEFDIMSQISTFYEENKFHEMNVSGLSGLEEIVLPSLERHFNEKKEIYRITYVFWELPDYTPNINQVISLLNENQNIYSVKRVNRKYNDPVRKYFREVNNNYINL
jgi:hypothetical protein